MMLASDLVAFWSIVSYAVVIGGAVLAALVLRYWFVTIPHRARPHHEAHR